jgi:hypothetical protein
MGEDVCESFGIHIPAPEGTEMVPVDQIEGVLRDTLRADGLSDETIEAMIVGARAGRRFADAYRASVAEFEERVRERAEAYGPWIAAALELADGVQVEDNA